MSSSERPSRATISTSNRRFGCGLLKLPGHDLAHRHPRAIRLAERARAADDDDPDVVSRLRRKLRGKHGRAAAPRPPRRRRRLEEDQTEQERCAEQQPPSQDRAARPTRRLRTDAQIKSSVPGTPKTQSETYAHSSRRRKTSAAVRRIDRGVSGYQARNTRKPAIANTGAESSARTRTMRFQFPGDRDIPCLLSALKPEKPLTLKH